MQNKPLDLLAIFGAKHLIFILIMIAAIYFFKLDKTKRKEMFLFGASFMLPAYLILKLIGHFYFSTRPFVAGNFAPLISHDANNGFPSDHTALSCAVAMTIYYFDKKLGHALLLLAIIVGLSRVYAGVHHLTDILGTAIFMVAASYLVYHYLMPILKKALKMS